MSSEHPVGIIELGNKDLKCLIFSIDKSSIKILSTSIISSEGIYNGSIINLSNATNAIRNCINNAEKKAKVSLKKIYVVLEQTDFLCTKFSKHRKIDGSKISKDDIDFLLREAKKQLILNDKNQSVLHIFNHNYIVDGKIFIEEPIGLYANEMSHEITFITLPKNNLKNIRQVFNDCDIEIERLISSTFASGVQLLDSNDLKSGTILLDLGLEKFSLGIFKNLALIHSITLPIGIKHITNDISKVCSLNAEQSENIRNNIDFSLNEKQSIFDKDNYLKNIYFINSNFRKISKNLILNIIKSRLDEILEIVKRQMTITRFKPTPGVNIFLKGDGSNLINLDKYLENFFKLNIKKMKNSSDNEKEYDKNFNFYFSTCLGAIKIIKDGWETEAIAEKNNKGTSKIGFFAKIFGNN